MKKSIDNKQFKLKQSARQNNLRISNLIRNIDTGGYELEIEFASVSGVRASIRVPRAITPADLLKTLRNYGAKLPSNRQKALGLIQNALDTEPKESLQVTKRGGWHKDSFVHRRWTEGSNQSLRLKEQIDNDNPMNSRAGKLLDWKKGLEKACLGSSYLSFGIGVSFAAPLLGLIGENEGAMFNFHGPSSSGKSLTCRTS